MPGFLFSLSFHEAAHGYVANKFGDPTAKMMGRVTLNPVPHTDILGTLILPISGLLFGGFLFGWGKPVPVNYRNLKNVKRDALWISAAGPLSNLILVFCFAGVINAFRAAVPTLAEHFTPFVLQKIYGALIQVFALNVALCIFNLIPIQPLDGSKILFGILPTHLGVKVDQFTTRYGMIILIALMLFGVLPYLIMPFLSFFSKLLLGM